MTGPSFGYDRPEPMPSAARIPHAWDSPFWQLEPVTLTQALAEFQEQAREGEIKEGALRRLHDQQWLACYRDERGTLYSAHLKGLHGELMLKMYEIEFANEANEPPGQN